MDYELLKKLYDIDSFTGCTEEEIEELCEGFDTIPGALADFLETCGKTTALFAHSNDHWIDLEYCRKYSWMKTAPQDYYYLLNENQGVYQVAIRRADMGLPDPPVYVVERNREGAVTEVGKAEESLTAFLMGMLLYEAVLSLEYDCGDFIWYEPEDVEKIESILQKYPYHVYNWYSERIDIYTLTGEELLFIMKGDTPNGTYSAKSEEALRAIDEKIGDIGER